MEKLMDQISEVDLRGHVCLYGFDEETDSESLRIYFAKGHIDNKASKVRVVLKSTGVSLSAALSLCEVTPAEWELMRDIFIQSQ